MSTSLDNIRLDHTAVDSASDAFLFGLNWSAEALIDAVRWSPPPLHRFDFAPSANDTATHRPRRRGSFLASTPQPLRFRIGG